MKTILTLLFTLLLVGCELDELAEVFEGKDTDAKPTPHEVEVAPVVTPVSGDKSTLLKPVSESRGGRAAVLAGCEIRDVTKVTINGVEDVFEYRPGYANGERVHTFLGKTGSAYPANSHIKVWGDGKVFYCVWPDPSKRWRGYLKEVE